MVQRLQQRERDRVLQSLRDRKLKILVATDVAARGLDVPEVLRSGDHGAVERWRAEQAREITRRRRPDLLGERER